MLNHTSQALAESQKEFDERFKCIQTDCAGGGHTYPSESEPEGGQCQFCAEYLFPIKSFLHSRQIKLLTALCEDLEIKITQTIEEQGADVDNMIDAYQRKISALSDTISEIKKII